jgi:4-aminobutyrate aminotransferase-like enzyme
VEKLAAILPGDLNGFQFYDCGTAAVEAGIRVLRAASGKHETVSCFYDFHGKTYGAVSLGHIRSHVYGAVRAPGAHMVPRPDTYRPLWTKADGTIDTDAVHRSTTSTSTGPRSARSRGSCSSRSRAGAARSCRRTTSSRSSGNSATPANCCSWPTRCSRAGAAPASGSAMEHWGVVPDVVTLGKGFGNGFPVTAVAVREPYKESFEAVSASSSYGGNPMACAAALASTEVIEQEGLLAHADPPRRNRPRSGCSR